VEDDTLVAFLMKFLRHFLSGYRLPFAQLEQESGGSNLLRRKLWILIALVVIAAGIFKFFTGTKDIQHEVAGHEPRVAKVSPEGEIRLGLVLAQEVIRQFGGEVADPKATGLVRRVGQRIVDSTSVRATPFRFRFHLLRDDQTINAFALPGGQIFITAGLLKVLKNEEQLAAVLGHEMGHVVGRHPIQQLAGSELLQSLTQDTGPAASSGRDQSSMLSAQYVDSLMQLKHGRDEELEADALGVRFLIECGYDPENMIGVMEILTKAGGSRQPQILSTHPDPGNRMEHIRAEIAKCRKS